jgi:hypothetical protein
LRQRSRINAETGCWHWSLSLEGKVAKVALHQTVTGKSTKMRGPRAAIILERGSIPSHFTAWLVCKHFDCVNPEHVRTGTKKQHGAWLTKCGFLRGDPKRSAASRKTARARSKLDLEKVREIRASNESRRALADRYGVSPWTISEVSRNKRWRDAVTGSSVFNQA